MWDTGSSWHSFRTLPPNGWRATAGRDYRSWRRRRGDGDEIVARDQRGSLA